MSQDRPDNAVECIPFTHDAFCDQVRIASQGHDEASPNLQTEYLASFMTELKAKVMLVEHHYLDRHFVEEVSSYYSKRFLQIQNHCTRVHFLTSELDEAGLDAKLEEAANGGADGLRTFLQAAYLGYVVIRPLPSVPIGRTIVKPWNTESRRFFGALGTYDVHLLGASLAVEGLAFQQQDTAVAACATTAVWTALQRVSKNEGFRAPTPAAITDAAVRHYVPLGRSLPSSGLTVEQMLDALRAFDFPAAKISVGGDVQSFLMQTHVYLRSGIPVILVIRTPNGGHAVTAVGYRRANQGPPSYPLGDPPVTLRSHNLDLAQIYVHDDRLGPYARVSFQDRQGPQDSALVLELELPGGGTEHSLVSLALAPLYPKLRTSARELIACTLEMGRWADSLATDLEKELGLEVWFDRSGTYQESLYEQQLSPERMARFQRGVALSRYVGVSRWYLDGEPFVDALWDTTDRIREKTHSQDSLLGLVMLQDPLRPDLQNLADDQGVPLW